MHTYESWAVKKYRDDTRDDTEIASPKSPSIPMIPKQKMDSTIFIESVNKMSLLLIPNYCLMPNIFFVFLFFSFLLYLLFSRAI